MSLKRQGVVSRQEAGGNYLDSDICDICGPPGPTQGARPTPSASATRLI